MVIVVMIELLDLESFHDNYRSVFVVASELHQRILFDSGLFLTLSKILRLVEYLDISNTQVCVHVFPVLMLLQNSMMEFQSNRVSVLGFSCPVLHNVWHKLFRLKAGPIL